MSTLHLTNELASRCDRERTTYPFVVGEAGFRFDRVLAFASADVRPRHLGLSHVISFRFEERWVSVFANGQEGVDATPFDGSFVPTEGSHGVLVLEDVVAELEDQRHLELVIANPVADLNDPDHDDTPLASSKFFGRPWSQDGDDVPSGHTLVCQLDSLDFGDEGVGLSWWFGSGLFQLFLALDDPDARRWRFRNVV